MPNELSNTILENIGDGVLSVDASLNVVFANRMACSILKVDHKTIIGKSLYEVMRLEVNSQNVRTEIDPFMVAIATGKQGTYAQPMLVESVKTEQVYIEDTVSPIRNSDGEIIGAVMVFRDVTDEVRMEVMLGAANQRYKILFDSIRSGVAVYESCDGVDFRIVDFNFAAEKIEGVGKDEVLGKKVQEAFPGSIAGGFVDIIRRVWTTGKSERLPCSFYEDNVRRGWRDNYIYKLPTGEVVAVYDDVTHKKDTAERISGNIGKLRDSEKRLRGMFDNSSVGVMVTGNPPEYPIIQANRAFCEFLGYTRQEIVDKTIHDITHPEDIDASFALMSRARSLPPSGGSINVLTRYLNKNGTVVWGSTYLSKIEHEDGRIEHFSQVVDVTDKKRSEDEREMLVNVVSELNSSDVKNRDTIRNIMLAIKDFVGLDAVAVRLPERIDPDNKVTDYPFYFHSGFDNAFVEEERSLCCRDYDHLVACSNGELECVCGAVITGKVDHCIPFFTEGGSFWTKSTSHLISEIGLEAIPVKRPREACWRSGYESVAVVPIMSGDSIVGSMLLNARRVGVFDERMVEFLEEIGKTMGVAFSRMQMMSDIDEHRKAIERANGILSVECDVAKNIADGSDSNLESVLIRAGGKLGVKWLCVVVVGDSGIIGRWTDERESGTASFIDEVAIDPKDASEVSAWIREKKTYSGNRGGLPVFLSRIAKQVEGHWMAVPVAGEKHRSPTGVVLMVSKNGKKWSKDECNAMEGLSTLLCILAKAEKNRTDLSRKIEETILRMHKSVALPTAGGSDAGK